MTFNVFCSANSKKYLDVLGFESGKLNFKKVPSKSYQLENVGMIWFSSIVLKLSAV